MINTDFNDLNFNFAEKNIMQEDSDSSLIEYDVMDSKKNAELQDMINVIFALAGEADEDAIQKKILLEDHFYKCSKLDYNCFLDTMQLTPDEAQEFLKSAYEKLHPNSQ